MARYPEGGRARQAIYEFGVVEQGQDVSKGACKVLMTSANKTPGTANTESVTSAVCRAV